MDINTAELDHITDRLTGALLRPLEERNAQLEQQNMKLQGLLEEANQTIAMQAMALQGAKKTIEELKDEMMRLRTEQNQQTLMTVICRQYIPLSKPATQEYVFNTVDSHDRALLAHFFMQTLSQDVPRQLTEEVRQMTQLPEKKPTGTTNNYFEAGSGAQVFNGEVHDSSFNPQQG